MGVENKRNVLLLTPSALIARGFESVFSAVGEFRVYGIVSDLSGGSDLRIRNVDSGVIIVDPAVFDYESRMKVRQYVPDSEQVAVVAVRTVLMNEDELRQYDETISLYDSPVTIVRKLRSAIASMNDKPKFEGEELSSREKEILVCVAKGMLNKEIADHFNISIYTVITHRKNITRKTGIRSVAGLTVYALLNRLIDPENVE